MVGFFKKLTLGISKIVKRFVPKSIKPKVEAQVTKQLKSKLKSKAKLSYAPFAQRKGFRFETKKKYTQYMMSMRRKSLDEDMQPILKYLKARYNIVKNRDSQYLAQRIAIAVGTKETPTLRKFIVKSDIATGEQYKLRGDNINYISTAFFARRKGDSEAMFNDLANKIQKFILKESNYRALYDDEEDIIYIAFLVIFQDEGR